MFDKIRSIREKNEIQNQGVKLFIQSKRVLFSWATGVGKTLGSLKCIKEFYDYNPNIKGYLICKENSHLSNWQNDIDEHSMQFINKCTESFLYDSLHKYSDKGVVDFIILDEAHAITDARLEHLLEIVGPNTAIIMLSATVTIEKAYLLKFLCKRYTEYHISISEAIERGILPPPKVYVHYYMLENKVRDKVYVYTKGNKNLHVELSCEFGEHTSLIKKNKNLSLSIKCTEKEYHDLIDVEIEKAKRVYFSTQELWAKNRWVNLGSQRKRFLSETKTERVRKLIDVSFKDSRFICFTGSKIQCEELGGKNYVHSGLKPEVVVEKKDNFNNKKISSLFVVNMFRESINLIDVQKGLIVQLDNVKLTFIQMLGRVFRSFLPEMHIMIIKDTRDEDYLKNVMKGFNQEYVKVINHDNNSN